MWLSYIYMVKPVGPRFGQMARKNLDWRILPRNRVYHLYKSVPFTEKRPRRPKTGLKDGFEEMEHEFPFGIFRPEKHDEGGRVFRCSVTPGNLPMERPKCHVPFSFQTDFPETFCKINSKQPFFPFLLKIDKHAVNNLPPPPLHGLYLHTHARRSLKRK